MALSLVQNPTFHDHTHWIYRANRQERLPDRTYLICKRILDLSLLFFSAPLWLPLMGLIFLSIKIASPKNRVLFSQLRTGKGENVFRCSGFAPWLRTQKK